MDDNEVFIGGWTRPRLREKSQTERHAVADAPHPGAGGAARGRSVLRGLRRGVRRTEDAGGDHAHAFSPEKAKVVVAVVLRPA